MTCRIGVHPEPAAGIAVVVIQYDGPQGQHPLMGGRQIWHNEVKVRLLGVTGVRPARAAMVIGPLEAQLGYARQLQRHPIVVRLIVLADRAADDGAIN